MKPLRRLLLAIPAMLLAVAGYAAEVAWIQLETRPGIQVPLFWAPQDQARATVILLPGGAGSIGDPGPDNWPSSANFLIRSGHLFAAQGLNVAMMSRPSNVRDLDFSTRLADWHMQDIAKIIEYVHAQSDAPIWLVGTSRGTVSAAAFAIAQARHNDASLLSGLVFTSSVTDRKPGALPSQALDMIRLPVLVVHHRKDACVVCQPHQAAYIVKALSHAPRKELILLDGGGNPSGDACEALHYHGYIGMEAEAVQAISDWITAPASANP
jgi:hypothetical protein